MSCSRLPVDSRLIGEEVEVRVHVEELQANPPWPRVATLASVTHSRALLQLALVPVHPP